MRLRIEEKIVCLIDEMSEFLSVSQMKKLQEVLLENLSERAEQKEQIDNSEYLSQDFLDIQDFTSIDY
jgi:integrase/recombinase XerD